MPSVPGSIATPSGAAATSDAGPALRLLAGLLFDQADEDLMALRSPLLAE